MLTAAIRTGRFIVAAAILTTLPALLGGCIVTCHVSECCPDSSGEAQALIGLDDAWSQAAAARDAEKVGAFYADDAIVYAPGAPMATGRADATAIWSTAFAEPSFMISWKSTDAHVSACGDIGHTAGAYWSSYTGADGRKVEERGKFLCIWKRQSDGSWKAWRDMWNSDAP